MRIYSIGLLSEEDDPSHAGAARLALGKLADASGGLDYYPRDLAEVESIFPAGGFHPAYAAQKLGAGMPGSLTMAALKFAAECPPMDDARRITIRNVSIREAIASLVERSGLTLSGPEIR